MRFNKAMVRPRSTRTITDFRGLWHNLEDQVQIANQGVMRWYDERNLSCDAAPALTARRKAATVANIDGNVIPNKVIAAETSGDHPVLLDDHGILYCNGHSVNTFGSYGMSFYWWIRDEAEANLKFSVYPRKGRTYDETKLGGLLTAEETTWRLIYTDPLSMGPANAVWTITDGTTSVAATYTYSQDTIGMDTVDTWILTDYGIVLSAANVVPENFTATITTWSEDRYSDDVYMVRMGANVIILPEGVMINAAKLAAGEAVEIEALNAEKVLQRGKMITFSPCLLDGTIVTPVIGTTEPNDKTAIWADTTGDRTVMRQWVSALESWQAMQQTYVRVDIASMKTGSGWAYDDIRQWDAVKFSPDVGNTEYYDSDNNPIEGTRLEDEFLYIIYSSQVVYKRESKPNASPPVGYIVIEGILDKPVHLMVTKDNAMRITRSMPEMNYVVECGNRLWGCYYGPNEDGTNILNEIYASKLGDPKNWSCYQGLSTDSWTASRGTSAPFTGAAVLDNSPLFFREEWLEKVYPSSTGAHQIQTYSVDGVEKGSHRSLLVIDDKLYYKSRLGVMVYEGTLPRSISAAFGDMVFHDGNAGRHQKRYEISMLDSSNAKITGVYDIGSGDWHLETGGWEGIAFCWKDELYFTEQNLLVWEIKKRYGGTAREDWSAETGIISYELPEHKFVSCVRIRLRMNYNSWFKPYIRYEGDTDWTQKGYIYHSDALTAVKTYEFNIYPLRCDHFRLKFEGKNGAEIISISYRLERSEGGH